MRFLQAFTWDGGTANMGGLSAILMQPSGQRALVLGDRGDLFDLAIHRGADGIKALEILRRTRLVDNSAGTDVLIDSEGLALASATDVFVSFEYVNQIARLNTRTGAKNTIATPPSFGSMARNRGLEALAIDDKGALFTLAERPHRGFAVWRRDANGWDQPFTLEARNGFLAVSAEFGPDGRFYLLERRVTLFGFQSRLRRWDITKDAALNETTLLTTRAGQFGNLEGLSLWRDESGQLRATMVADDNFLPFLRTQLVEYALTE